MSLFLSDFTNCTQQPTHTQEQEGFDKATHKYLCTRRTHKGFKGTVVNRTLHERSLKITLTVHLMNLVM